MLYFRDREIAFSHQIHDIYTTNQSQRPKECRKARTPRRTRNTQSKATKTFDVRRKGFKKGKEKVIGESKAYIN